MLLANQISQEEIDAGAAHIIADVIATDSQGQDAFAQGIETVPLDTENGLSLGEIPLCSSTTPVP